MKLEFPEGYKGPLHEDFRVYAINRREFTATEWIKLVTAQRGERVGDHVRRVALALGLGSVSTGPATDRPAEPEWARP